MSLKLAAFGSDPIVYNAIALRAEVAHIKRAVRRKRGKGHRQDCSACRSHFSPFVTSTMFSFYHPRRLSE